ncbi:MAG: hypothetical protein M3Y82_08335, partial [Verrucomicrobiota bacterium]|nr:hypothetical protein [Verrucomicrobiota bacterium]
MSQSNLFSSKILIVQTGINRRKFIYSSALLASAATFGGNIFAQSKRKSANEKLDIAIIGSGGRGASNLKDVS